MGAAKRAELGVGGAGGMVALLCTVIAVSISVSIATRMSSMSGPDLRLRRWIRERRVAFSLSVAVAAVGITVRKTVGVIGAVDLDGAFSFSFPFSVT